MLKKRKGRTHEGCGNRMFCILAALFGGLLVWKIHSSRHPSCDD